MSSVVENDIFSIPHHERDKLNDNRCPKTDVISSNITSHHEIERMFHRFFLDDRLQERPISFVNLATEWEQTIRLTTEPLDTPRITPSNRFLEITYKMTSSSVEAETMFIDRFIPFPSVVFKFEDFESLPPDIMVIRIYEPDSITSEFSQLCEAWHNVVPKVTHEWCDDVSIFFTVDIKGRVVFSRDCDELKRPDDKLYIRVGPNHYTIDALPQFNAMAKHTSKTVPLAAKFTKLQDYGYLFSSFDQKTVNIVPLSNSITDSIVNPQSLHPRRHPNASLLRRTKVSALLPRVDEDIILHPSDN